MIFSSLLFIYIFLPALFLLYYPVKNERWRRGVLIAFSLVFYAWGEPVYVLLLIAVSLAAYASGLLIEKYPKHGRLILSLSVALDAAVLALFKYAALTVSTVNLIPGLTLDVPQIALPVGISFFTFQAISYTADVYRSDARVQHNFSRLLLYITLFPQLIAGPIVRYKDIDEQLSSRTVDIAAVNEGIWRFCAGLCKKALIANNCGAAADSLFALSEATLLGSWGGALLFTLQLYFDFSGYSDMAIGLGRMFGFEFPENFNYPFAAPSITDFWRRWHISLGAFFRDYVYIPMGGNRRLQLRNLLCVWFLTGLWHGASWNFILWGLYFGALVVFEKYVVFPTEKKLPRILTQVLPHLFSMALVVFGMAIFYHDTDTAVNVGHLLGIGTHGFTDLYVNSILSQNAVLTVAAVLCSLPILPAADKKLAELFGEEKLYIPKRVVKSVLCVVLLAVSTVMIAADTYNPFLYYRF